MPRRTHATIAAAIAAACIGVIAWKASTHADLTRTQYLVMLTGLVMALGLASNSHEHLKNLGCMGTVTEAFDTTAAVASISSAMDTIAAIPLSMKTIIMDGLDNMASAMQQSSSKSSKSSKASKASKASKKSENEDEAGEADGSGDTVQMSPSLYEDDASLARTIGKRGVDDAKYRAMAVAYANIHYLMCNLKAADPAVYESVFRAVLAKNPSKP